MIDRHSSSSNAIDRPRRTRGWLFGVLAGVLLLSAALVWHDLGVREVLGRDENATITKLDQPDLSAVLNVTYMKVTGQPGNMQPLYFLVQRLFWPLVGRSAFMLRFLSAAFGLLAIVFTYKLGQALFSCATGIVGALFTALLMLHLQYSQIARPYTLLAMFALASAYFLVRALGTCQPLHWTGFVLTATLSFYTHYNSLLFFGAEALFTAVAWLAMLAAVLKRQESYRRLGGPLVAFLALGILCLPGLLQLSNMMGEEAGGQVPIELTWSFIYQFVYKIGLTTAWLRGLILGFMGFGLLAVLYRRRWLAALFVVLWLAVPFVILAVIKSPRPFVERYLIFVPPVALLLAGEGLATLSQIPGGLSLKWNRRNVRWPILIGLTVGLALLFVVPLRSYYAASRQADRLDQTLAVVERHAQPGDLIIVSPRFFVRPLNVSGARVLYLTKHLSLAEFDELLSHSQRTWVLYTSYLPPVELQEPLDQWIQSRPDEFVRVPIKAITALAYRNQTQTDPEARLQDRISILEDLAEISADPQEAWLRHEALAQAYESLAELYDSQGASQLATEYRGKAETARAAAPRPW